MNESVRRDLEEKVLASDVARRALEARLEQRDSGLSPLQKEAIEAQLASLDDEAKRLAAAIRKAPDIDVLLDELQKVEARRKLIKADLTVRPKVDAGALLDAKLDEWRRILRDPDVRQCTFDPLKARTWIEDRLNNWKRLLRNNREQGRQVLQNVLTERLESDGLTFRGTAVLGRILRGDLSRELLASPTGFVRQWQLPC